MSSRLNLFIAWFLIPQTVAMGFVAVVGRIVLELLGVNTHEGDIPGRLVGAILLLGAVYLILHFRGSLFPEGKPAGRGYLLGQRLVMIANLLAALFCLFQFTQFMITSYNVRHLLNGFTDAFGYWVMALWLIGFSFLYQSALPSSAITESTK
ncbi:MAG: hypothetical protein WC736_13975 [Gallionella sp.]|jgi:hypothetical protein